MPPTNDPELRALFDNPNIVWYTEDEIPKVYQHNIGGHSWVSVYKKISPSYERRNSNGNGEWPWDHPAVLDDEVRVRNVVGYLDRGMETFKTEFDRYAVVKANRGRGWEVEGFRKRGSEPGTGWKYGPGTEFVELVSTQIGKYDYTFKVHRMTMTPNNEWRFRVYRPFRSVAAYEQATRTKVGPPTLRTLMDTLHDIPAVVVKALQHDITEPLSPDLSARLLLETPFELCVDDEFIPTTKHPDQIWPVGYLGAFIGNAIHHGPKVIRSKKASCLNCHRDVAINVGKHSSGNWYGQIRGGGKDRNEAGVFSHRPLLRTWYGRGEQQTESLGYSVPSSTRRQNVSRPQRFFQPSQQFFQSSAPRLFIGCT